MFSLRALVGVCVCALLTLGPSYAAADTVVYSDSRLVRGRQLDVVELNLDQAGRYAITVTDLAWPDPLTTVSFGLLAASAPIGVVGPEDFVDGAGTLAFFWAAPGRASLLLFSHADRYGLVNIQASYVVALPSSVLLLGSALGLAWPLWRRRSRLSAHAELRPA